MPVLHCSECPDAPCSFLHCSPSFVSTKLLFTRPRADAFKRHPHKGCLQSPIPSFTTCKLALSPAGLMRGNLSAGWIARL